SAAMLRAATAPLRGQQQQGGSASLTTCSKTSLTATEDSDLHRDRAGDTEEETEADDHQQGPDDGDHQQVVAAVADDNNHPHESNAAVDRAHQTRSSVQPHKADALKQQQDRRSSSSSSSST